MGKKHLSKKTSDWFAKAQDSHHAGEKTKSVVTLSRILLTCFFFFNIIFTFVLLRYFYQKGANYGQASVGNSAQRQLASGEEGGEAVPVPKEKPAPVFSKGIYISSWIAGTPGRMQKLIDLIKRTELNTVVIDIKDSTGKISFDTNVLLADEIGSEEIRIKNLPELLDKLHQENIYVIGRIVVFQDPYLAEKRPSLALKDNRNGKIWRNNGGIAWVDSASKEVWDYNLQVAKESARLGFDEINFDYVRFPSDGKLSAISYPFWDGVTPKYEIIGSFFKYLSENLKSDGVFLSADLFGLSFYQDDDLNIGQKLSVLLPYFDYLCPMVYPSHYWTGFEGYENPSLHPYEVIYGTLEAANPLLADESIKTKFRPWLQDFDLGAVYDATMIKKEIKAANDANSFGWLLWNASNVYTESALLPETGENKP